jgi:hypothetical protein
VRGDEYASLFLEAKPYMNGMSFDSNETFAYAIRARYAIGNADMFEPGQRCVCQRGIANACMDVYGEHFVSGCGKFGFRQKIHDSVVSAVYDCVRLAELPATLEDKSALRDTGNEGNERPDISTKLPIRSRGIKDCLVEVTVGNTINGTVSGNLKLTDGQDKQAGKCAAKKFGEKARKYTQLLANNTVNNANTVFRIVAVETTGRLHPASVKYINQLAEIAAQKRKWDVYSMRRYMFMKISVALFNSMGKAINRRIGGVNNFQSATLEDFEDENLMIRQATRAD